MLFSSLSIKNIKEMKCHNTANVSVQLTDLCINVGDMRCHNSSLACGSKWTCFLPLNSLGWKGIVVAWADGWACGVWYHVNVITLRGLPVSCCNFIGMFSTSKSQMSSTLTFV